MCHIGLPYKLRAAQPGLYYLLLKSNLTDGYSQVRYNGTCSDCYEMSSGVPRAVLLAT